VDPSHRLRHYLRVRLDKALKGNFKVGSFVRDLGCTVPELKLHLELKFQPGMSWDNWGNGPDKWNLDHIKPLSSFDLINREQFLKACHWTNLQPLWWIDNVKKGDKFE
jgi:hypothetical protein